MMAWSTSIEATLRAAKDSLIPSWRCMMTQAYWSSHRCARRGLIDFGREDAVVTQSGYIAAVRPPRLRSRHLDILLASLLSSIQTTVRAHRARLSRLKPACRMQRLSI